MKTLKLTTIFIVSGVLNFCISDLFAQNRTFYQHGFEITHFGKEFGDVVLSRNDVDHVYKDDDGRLWMINVSNSYRYDGLKMEEFVTPDSILYGDVRDQLSLLYKTSGGIIWYSSGAGGWISYDPDSHTYKRFNLYDNQWRDDFGWNMVEDDYGQLWAGCGSGLVHIKDQVNPVLELNRVKSLVPYLLEVIDSSEWKEKTIVDIIQVSNDKHITKSFQIESNQQIVVLAQGELNHDASKYLDHGWITDESGRIIWDMQPKASLNGGKMLTDNRMHLEFPKLAAGTYQLHYKTNEKYAYGDYVPSIYRDEGLEKGFEIPPDIPNFWGIMIMDINEQVKTSLEISLESYRNEDKLVSNGTLVHKDLQGNIWVAGKGGLQRVIVESDGSHQFETHWDWQLYDKRTPWDIWDIKDKDNNNLWIMGKHWVKGEENSIIGIYDKDSRRFTEINSGIPKTDLLDAMIQDNEGNLWISGHGVIPLYRLSPPFYNNSSKNKPELQTFYLRYSGSDPAPIGIKSMTLDDANNLWLGTHYSFIYKINLDTPDYVYYDFNNYDNISERSLYTILADQHKNCWVSRLDQGLIRFNMENEEYEWFDNDFKGIGFDKILPLFVSESGKVLFSRQFEDRSDLIEYDPDSNRSKLISIEGFQFGFGHDKAFFYNDTLLYVPNGYLINTRDWTIEVDLKEYLIGRPLDRAAKSHEGIWFGSRYGEVGHFAWDGAKLDTLFLAFLNSYLSELYVDKDGEIWVGMRKGIQENGFSKPFTNRLGGKKLNDSEGNIWVFSDTRNGLIRYPYKEVEFPKKFREIKTSLGQFDAFKGKGGDFYVLGKQGVYTFSPDNIRIDSLPPKVIINSIIQHENEETKSELSFLNALPLSFEYDNNSLSIEYLGVQFNNPEELTYQYQLKGKSNDWQDVGKERIARFLNLTHGHYIFNVRAANEDKVWSDPESISFTILPPWWLTWWAYTVYSLTALGSLMWFVQSQRKKVIAKQKELEKEQEHIQELQSLNIELKDINEANQRFVPQDFMQILGKKKIQDLKLGDQTQIKMTILFSDIRSYTMLSETMSPDDNFKFINGYLGRIGPIIKKHGGFIDKYMGDGLMALFLDNHQAAIKAVVEMQKLLEEYNVERRSKGRQAIRTGMGLNTGPLMLGIIGDQNRYDSTVIADAVNTASRMEGLTKIFGASIIISEKTLEELRSGKEKTASLPFAYRYLGKVKVKGRDKAIGIYDLYEGDVVSIRQLKAKTQETFEEGILHYFNRQFGKSAECFKQVLEVNESDLAAQYYLDKSVEYIINEVPEDWNGVEEMVMK